ncbi:hypothetical protein OG413_39425 [Streptomyces sp. NBC_01433]|uniref:hypothetical protein n=1 Tax=Streptomyces sp. NBC_01433 TaxID=2903864 RepID=UPI00224CA5EA|nr:hypothetical protein [Streptomyces sp. NBC_01433]MCX4681270.1 hypothetical protein [Streptomyces sp. NBC_01433]
MTTSPSRRGVSVSALVSTSSFGCLRSNGYNFAVMRGYQSVGRVDPNLAGSVANASAAGMEEVDVYAFPCYSCGNGAGQARTLIDHSESNGVKYGRLWLAVEGPGTYWGSSVDANTAFIADYISTIRERDVPFGITTTSLDWDAIGR